MTITTPLQDRARTAAVGEVPAQRTAPPSEQPTTMVPPQRLQEPAGAVRPASVPAVRPVPGQAGTARPTRVAPARAEPLRRRWPAIVGGLAAGLTLGTVGAVGAAFALSLTATAPTPAVPTSAVQQTGLSPNVSVPGRVLTAVGDGTWQVGVDIAPGTYTTRGAVVGATCTHALRSARSGGKVAARSTTPGRTTVVLTAADGWFATSGCATWRRLG